ncbi:MAG: TetR/AcrR family transcriptional regulator [Kofleriaceae bacterium]
MARPKAFDPEQALDRAMELFRRKGYAATTTSDLTDEMQIGRGSLFSSFGTKDQIFFAALCRYQERSFGHLVASLDAARSPLQAIRSIFEAITQEGRAERPFGCLMVNSTVELAPHAPDVQRYLARSWERLEEAFERAISRGQELHEISRRQTSRALARFLVTMLRGVGVGNKMRPDKDMWRDTLSVVFAALEP